MRIGYFSHSGIGISETFIHDLIVQLAGRCEHLTFVSGALEGHKIEEIPCVYTGYFSKAESKAYLYYKLGQLAGGKGDLLKFRHIEKSIRQTLRSYKDVLENIDVAFVDYGTSAVYLHKIFAELEIPFIIRVLGYDVTSSFASDTYKAAFLQASQQAAGIIAVSEHLKRMLVIAGVSPHKISVVNLGIRDTDVEPLSWKERLQHAPSIMHLGRLTPKKNPLALIQAFAVAKEQVTDARLTIVGDGPLMQPARDRANQLGLSASIDFKGALSREYAFPLLNRHLIFAQHSVTSINGDQEGFPVSPAEAAMHALPVVSTIHSGLAEQIVDGHTGFLVQEHDYVSMGERFIYLLQNPDKAEAMGNAGRDRILKICNPIEKVDEIYHLLEAAHFSRSTATLSVA